MTAAQLQRMAANLNGNGNRPALNVEGIPGELRDLRQWVVWHYAARNGDKPTKVPYQPNGKPAKSNDAATWASFAECRRAYETDRKWSGVGLMLADDLAGLDADNCIDDQGHISELVQGYVSRLNSYSEVTPSGHGVRVLFRGRLPEGRRKSEDLRLELYDAGRGRFFTVTGRHIIGTPETVEPRESEAAAIHAEVFADPPKPDPWKIQTLTDAFTERPPIRWLVSGVLPVEALAIVYGAPGALKSMLLADLAVCVAAGKPWLVSLPGSDAQAFTVSEPAPVLWLDVDNGARRTADRFEALARAHGVHPSAPLHYVSMPTPPFVAGDAESVRNMAARILANGYKLVIIDNLSAIKGNADENSDGMALVMAALRQLTEATGAAIVVIHHQRKGQARANDGQGTRDGESLRGHSSIEASIDLALLVMRENGTPNVMVKSTKDRDAGVMPFAAAFTFEHDDTGRLHSARMAGLEATDRAEAKAAEQTNRLKDQIRQLLVDEGQLSGNAIETGVTGGRAAVRQVLVAMHLAGEVSVTEGARRAKLYDLRTQK